MLEKRSDLKESIPIPANRMVLLDLDKTIVDTQYQITNPSVLEVFQEMQQNGWILGLNSDTPLEPLKLWSDNLGLNGPVVAERGAVIMHHDGEVEILDDSEAYFSDLRNRFVGELSENRMAYYHGDVTQILREGVRFPGVVERELMLVQAYRRCSFNFFSRVVAKDGSLLIDNDLTEQHIQLTQSIMQMYQPDFELEIDFNPDYGICIISPERVTKRIGVKRLMEKFQLSQIGIIGDSMSDYVGRDVAIQYAVGNALETYKNEADYVSQGEYSDGVIEILNSFK